jgi:hypothetical protein
VGVDVADAGLAGDGRHDAMDCAAVEGCVLVGQEPAMPADVVHVGCGPFGEQLDELGVQRDDPVVAELAHRHPQPLAVADLGDGVGSEVAQLAGPQPGAGDDLDHDAVAG